MAGRVLVWLGDLAISCASLIAGVLKLMRAAPDGRQQIVGLLFAGDLVGQAFATAADTIVALCDADLCAYPCRRLEAVFAAQPGAAARLSDCFTGSKARPHPDRPALRDLAG